MKSEEEEQRRKAYIEALTKPLPADKQGVIPYPELKPKEGEEN